MPAKPAKPTNTDTKLNSAAKPAPRQNRPPRVYTDSDKATLLATVDLTGGNLAKAAGLCGVETAAARDWAATEATAPDPQTTALVAEKREDLATMVEQVAYRLIRIPQALIDKAGLQQRMTSFGIAVDKMRLLREQPTVINESRQEKRLWAEARIAEIAERFALSREQALVLAREHAPTLAEWVK